MRREKRFRKIKKSNAGKRETLKDFKKNEQEEKDIMRKKEEMKKDKIQRRE